MSTRLLIGGTALALGLFVLLLILTRQPPAEAPKPKEKGLDPDTTEGESKPTPKTATKPYLDGWTKPAAALLFSAGMHGYIEPCGCTSGQLGGLSRRGDLIEKLRAKDWKVIGLDAGGLLGSERVRRKQAQYKLVAAIDSLKTLGYGAIALGAEEVQANTDVILSRDDPFVSANVQFLLDASENPSVAEVIENTNGRTAWKLIDVGGTKVAVTAVFGLKYQAESLGPMHKTSKVAAVDPAAAIKEVLPKMQQAKPDLLVLLAHASVDESKALAKQFPQFQIVATAGGAEDPGFSPQYVGETLLVLPGGKGKRVAVVGYYPQEKPSLKFELVDLDEARFTNLAAMDDLMRKYQEDLESVKIALSEPPINHPGNSIASGEGLTYTGAAKCGECHKKAFSKWENSKHAHAFDSLIKGRKGQKNVISRIHDPECLACHVTGWDPKGMVPYNGGYLFEAPLVDRKGKPTKPDLKGQQCENCHNPGSAHVSEEELWKKTGKTTAATEKWRKFMRLDQKLAENQVCVRCHDGENDPHFGKTKLFKDYWEEIKHPGKD